MKDTSCGDRKDDAVGLLSLRVIVPVTEWQDRYAQARWMVRLDPDPGNGLAKVSAADAFQVRSVSPHRLIRPLGRLSAPHMKELEGALAVVLRLSL